MSRPMHKKIGRYARGYVRHGGGRRLVVGRVLLFSQQPPAGWAYQDYNRAEMIAAICSAFALPRQLLLDGKPWIWPPEDNS